MILAVSREEKKKEKKEESEKKRGLEELEISNRYYEVVITHHDSK